MSMTTEEALRSVIVYSSGLVACSACAPADMPVEEVEAAVNRKNPTGIGSKWRKSDEAFSGGEPNPTPCNDGPLKLHYLFEC